MDQIPSSDGRQFKFYDNLSELKTVLQEFDAALLELKKDVRSPDLQCNVCLNSRSAFTEFYSVSELNGQIDSEAFDTLRELFNRALELLPVESSYRTSVSDRADQFEEYCDELTIREEG